jgi:hypothetical protein
VTAAHRGGADRPAGRVATGLLWAATLVLPHGVSRDRYRREFAAELYGQSRGRQFGYALSACGSMWSLRTVLVHGAGINRVPFLCRTNLHHHWQNRISEEGLRFKTCSRCGRETGGLAGSSINSLFLPIGRTDH